MAIERFKQWLCRWLGLSRELEQLNKRIVALENGSKTDELQHTFDINRITDLEMQCNALQKQVDQLRTATIHKEAPPTPPKRARSWREVQEFMETGVPADADQ